VFPFFRIGLFLFLRLWPLRLRGDRPERAIFCFSSPPPGGPVFSFPLLYGNPAWNSFLWSSHAPLKTGLFPFFHRVFASPFSLFMAALSLRQTLDLPPRKRICPRRWRCLLFFSFLYLSGPDGLFFLPFFYFRLASVFLGGSKVFFFGVVHFSFCFLCPPGSRDA